jgi:hypothetical protein
MNSFYNVKYRLRLGTIRNDVVPHLAMKISKTENYQDSKN